MEGISLIVFVGHVIVWTILFAVLYRTSKDILSPGIVIAFYFYFFYVLGPAFSYLVLRQPLYFPNSNMVGVDGYVYALFYSVAGMGLFLTGILLGKKSNPLTLSSRPFTVDRIPYYRGVALFLILINLILGIKYYILLGGFTGAMELVKLGGRNATVENMGFYINGMRLTLVGYVLLVCVCSRKYMWIVAILSWLIISVEFGVGLSRARALFYGSIPLIALYLRYRDFNLFTGKRINKIKLSRNFVIIIASIVYLVIALSWFRGFIKFEGEESGVTHFVGHLSVVYFNRYENLLITTNLYEEDILENWTYFSSFGPIRRHLNMKNIFPSGGKYVPANTLFEALAFNDEHHGAFNSDLLSEAYLNFKYMGLLLFLPIGIIFGKVASLCQTSVEGRALYAIFVGWWPYSFMAGGSQIFPLVTLIVSPFALLFFNRLMKEIIQKKQRFNLSSSGSLSR